MPITAFSGVRISWLIAARNELFASFACSAGVLSRCRLSSIGGRSGSRSNGLRVARNAEVGEVNAAPQLGSPDRHHADHQPTGAQGTAIIRYSTGSAGPGDRDGPGIAGHVVDDLSLAPPGQIADDPLAELDAVGLHGAGERAEGHDRSEDPAILLGQEDRTGVRGEERHGAIRDALQHGSRVQHGRDLGGDLGEAVISAACQRASRYRRAFWMATPTFAERG